MVSKFVPPISSPCLLVCSLQVFPTAHPLLEQLDIRRVAPFNPGKDRLPKWHSDWGCLSLNQGMCFHLPRPKFDHTCVHHPHLSVGLRCQCWCKPQIQVIEIVL